MTTSIAAGDTVLFIGDGITDWVWRRFDSADGVHPTPAGHDVLAQAWLAAVEPPSA
jgi:lysophospholipase L1-like esterase